MITEFKAFFTLFQQGKALANSGIWSQRTAAINALGGFLASSLIIAKGFGYDFNIDQETLNAAAGGVVSIVFIANSIMHVITSKDAGLQSKGNS